MIDPLLRICVSTCFCLHCPAFKQAVKEFAQLTAYEMLFAVGTSDIDLKNKADAIGAGSSIKKKYTVDKDFVGPTAPWPRHDATYDALRNLSDRCSMDDGDANE